MSSRKKKQWRLSHKQPKERLKRPRPTKLHQSPPTKKPKHLYPFQEALLNDVETRLTKSRGTLVVSPPGSGKSVMIGALIKKFTDQQKEVWFMVHRKELIAQIEDNYQNTSKYLYNRMKYVFDQQLEQQVEKRKRKCTYRR